MTLNPVAVSLHHDQQRLMRQFLRQKFGDTPRLRFANLGDAVDLKDTSLCYDGMHLTAAGNERIAAALLPDVRALLR
jgi:lysophospholipase L1-like esterase